MSYHTLTATQPTDTPAVAPCRYDRWWVTQLVIQAPAPGQGVQLDVMLRKARATDGGPMELSPVDAPASVHIEDLFTLAASDPDAAAALDGVLAAIHRIGVRQGVL